MDTENLIYLAVLLVLLAGSYLLASRTNIAQTLRYAGIWGIIFMAAILAVGAWDDLRRVVDGRASVAQDGSEIRVRQSMDGHFYLNLQVNGEDIRFLVDTGATDIVLTQEDAARAGLDVEGLMFLGSAQTANGIVRTAPVRLDSLGLGPIRDSNVRAVVNGGELGDSLLGMRYLQRYGSILIENGELILRR